MTTVAMITTIVRTRIMTGVLRNPCWWVSSLRDTLGKEIGDVGWGAGGVLQKSSLQYAWLCHPVP